MSQDKPENVVALVLAAGASRRFGGDKRIAQLASGQGLLAASLEKVCAQLADVWIVLREGDNAQALGVAPGIRLVPSQAAVDGMGHSLADGIAAIARQSEADAVAIFLGDMPWIEPQTIERLLREADAQRIVLPTYQGEPGHPVIFGREFWPALTQLTGDAGAKAVVQANARAVLRVALNDPGITQDVDTPKALK